MKRKNLNVVKLRDIYIRDKKIAEIYFKLKLILSKNKKNNSFVAAISGGPDSMALAFLAKVISIEKKIRGYFILVDHQIRKDSEREALEASAKDGEEPKKEIIEESANSQPIPPAKVITLPTPSDSMKVIVSPDN